MSHRFRKRGLGLALATAAAPLAVAIWLLLTGGATAAGGAPSLQPNADLPDLAEAIPSHFAVVPLRVGRQKFYALAFQTVAENLAANGDGELYVVGHRSNKKIPAMTAEQYVNIKDPHTGAIVSQQMIPNIGRLTYERTLAGHDHWHLADFEVYSLARASDGRVVSRDRKVGFCLTSDTPVSDPGLRAARDPAGAHARAVTGLISYKDDTPNQCGRHQPRLTRVIESLNPGTGDVYERYLGGQNVDITNVPSGRYVLAIQVNPEKRLAETNYNNDFASALLSIHRARRGATPMLRVLRLCPGTARCPAS